MNKLRDVTKRLSLKVVSRHSKLEEKTKGLQKAGKSVNSIIGMSQRGADDMPFESSQANSGTSPRQLEKVEEASEK